MTHLDGSLISMHLGGASSYGIPLSKPIGFAPNRNPYEKPTVLAVLNAWAAQA